MRLREIGILLLQIDIEQCQLVRLLPENGLGPMQAYEREFKRIEKMQNRALQELDELRKQRYWRGSKIR
ncbi:MAG: hypothetical protein AAF310_04855 [Myxococcota bacterium]